jgi:hypothetical protein
VVTERIDFTATDFFDFYSHATPPFTTTSGSFTVTFDTTGVAGDTLGVIVNSWSPVLSDSAVAYTYSGGIVALGGIASAGVHGMHNFGISDRDFTLQLRIVPGTPIFSEMSYMVPGNDSVFSTGTGVATMTVVPEPASLALLAMVFGSRWRSSCGRRWERRRSHQIKQFTAKSDHDFRHAIWTGGSV